MLNHTTLESYYVVTFELVQHHKYSLTEIEEMMPFELSMYLEMLLKHLEEEKLERERAQSR